MSSELLEFVKDDGANSVYLDMNVHCHAWLWVSGDDEDLHATYHLTPDQGGIERAKGIISGLEAWIEKVGLNDQDS